MIQVQVKLVDGTTWRGDIDSSPRADDTWIKLEKAEIQVATGFSTNPRYHWSAASVQWFPREAIIRISMGGRE